MSSDCPHHESDETPFSPFFTNFRRAVSICTCFLSVLFSELVLYLDTKESYARISNNSSLLWSFQALLQSDKVCSTLQSSTLLIWKISKNCKADSLVDIRALHPFLHASCCPISRKHWSSLPTDAVCYVYNSHIEKVIESVSIVSSS